MPLEHAVSWNRIRLTDPLQNPGACETETFLTCCALSSSRRSIVNKTKYWVGIIGLAVGFFISFVLTSNYNKSNAGPPASGTGTAAAGGAGGGPSQQAMMGQVQAVIERAKGNPNDFKAQIEAATVFNQINRAAETVDYLKKAYAIDPTKFNELKAAGFIGQYYYEQKDYNEAETWFNRAIKAEPNEAELYVALAETYVDREPQQLDQAIAQLQQALKISPKNGHALSHLFETYALKKDIRAAEDTLKRFKEADPANTRIAKLEPVLADLKAGKAVTIPKE